MKWQMIGFLCGVMVLWCSVSGSGEEAATGAKATEVAWPRYRGPRGDSISLENDWRPAALSPAPKIQWRAQVGQGYSSVCIAGQCLYTMGYGDGQDTVYCLDVECGKEVWRFNYACEEGSYPGPRATPLFADGRLYTVGRTGLLHCLDVASGKMLWKLDMVADANGKPPQWGIASSACLDGDLVVVNVGRYGLAVNRHTGKVEWQSPKDLCGYASPVFYQAEGRQCMVCYGEKAAYGVEVKSGKLLWSQPWISRLSQHSADPVVWQEHVFISSVYSKGCTLFSIAGGEAREVWLNQQMTNKFGTSVLIDGNLFGIHGNAGSDGEGLLRCVDFMTGKVRWEQDMLRMSTLSAAGNKLLILTENGYLHVAEVRADAYRELARGRVIVSDTSREKAAPGKCWTAPVLCRGRVFCRSDRGVLVCVDMR